MFAKDILERVDQLIRLGTMVMGTTYASGGGTFRTVYVKESAMTGFRSAALSFIDRTYGRAHPYYQQFEQGTQSHYPRAAETGLAILDAIRGEISGGWLSTVKSLVSAELFADFLEMAEHLLETGYKDPAAVMAGSVLEEHLRQLCQNRGLNIAEEKEGKMQPKKADRLNADLCKAEAYAKLDQKVITAWLDLRNNAAHGKYAAYNADQVTQMLNGVAEFIARVPA